MRQFASCVQYQTGNGAIKIKALAPLTFPTKDIHGADVAYTFPYGRVVDNTGGGPNFRIMPLCILNKLGVILVQNYGGENKNVLRCLWSNTVVPLEVHSNILVIRTCKNAGNMNRLENVDHLVYDIANGLASPLHRYDPQFFRDGYRSVGGQSCTGTDFMSNSFAEHYVSYYDKPATERRIMATSAPNLAVEHPDFSVGTASGWSQGPKMASRNEASGRKKPVMSSSVASMEKAAVVEITPQEIRDAENLSEDDDEAAADDHKLLYKHLTETHASDYQRWHAPNDHGAIIRHFSNFGAYRDAAEDMPVNSRLADSESQLLGMGSKSKRQAKKEKRLKQREDRKQKQVVQPVQMSVIQPRLDPVHYMPIDGAGHAYGIQTLGDVLIAGLTAESQFWVLSSVMKQLELRLHSVENVSRVRAALAVSESRMDDVQRSRLWAARFGYPGRDVLARMTKEGTAIGRALAMCRSQLTLKLSQ